MRRANQPGGHELEIPIQTGLVSRSSNSDLGLHDNHIKFAHNPVVAPMKHPTEEQDPAELPVHKTGEFVPRIYASEMQYKGSSISDEESSIGRFPPIDQNPKSRKPSAAKRIKKQFSFASRGRTTDEEKVGLTDRTSVGDIPLRDYSTSSDSEDSRSSGDERLYGAM